MSDHLKIWTRAGVVLVAAGAIAATAPPAHAETGAIVLAAAGAGEGGEGGEAGHAHGEDALAGAPPDMALAVNLGMIRGHLRAAEELAAAGRFDEAMPHVLHPVEEIYEGIESDLARLKAEPFEDRLKALKAALETKDKAAFAVTLGLARDGIAAAEKTLPAASDALAFELRRGLLLLRSATPEYQEAIKDGKIVNVVEYQDARGFVQEADAVLSEALSGLEAKDAQAAADVKRALEALRQAFPTIEPPQTPVKSPGAVMGLTSLVELSVSPHTGN